MSVMDGSTARIYTNNEVLYNNKVITANFIALKL